MTFEEQQAHWDAETKKVLDELDLKYEVFIAEMQEGKWKSQFFIAISTAVIFNIVLVAIKIWYDRFDQIVGILTLCFLAISILDLGGWFYARKALYELRQKQDVLNDEIVEVKDENG